MHHKYHVRNPSPHHRRQSGVSPGGKDDENNADMIASILSSKAAEYSRSIWGELTTSVAQVTPTSAPIVLQTTSEAPVVVTTTSLPQISIVVPTTTALPTTSSSSVVSSAQPTTTTSQNPVVLSTSSTVSATPSSTAANSNADSKSSSGASPVVIGVVVTIIVLMAVAACVYFLRKFYVNKRQKKRHTWNPPAGNDYTEKQPEPQQAFDEQYETIDINEKHGPTPVPYPFTVDNINNQSQQQSQQSTYTQPQAYPQSIAMPAPPPPLHPTGIASLRSPSPPPTLGYTQQNFGPAPIGFDGPSVSSPPVIPFTPFSSVNPPTLSVMSPPATGSALDNSPSSGRTGTLLTVVRTFVPSLPDELSLQPGEQVRMIEKYDDGWALCERMSRGAGVESGVVPVECLETIAADSASIARSSVHNGGHTVSAGTSSPVSGPPGSVPGMGMMQERVDSWRLSKRASSLHPVGAGKY